MYALRKINNHYADFAGTRSDFLVVGHPEFNLGVAGCDGGYKPEWDTTPTPHHIPRSLPGDRMRRSGSLAHIKRVTSPTLDTTGRPVKGTLKARALSRSASHPIDPGKLPIDAGGSFQDIDSFMADLARSAKLPPVGMQVASAGYGNHIRGQPKCKHYAMVQEDLNDFRVRMKSAPQKVREELLEDDAWKYFASHLEQARRREAEHRRQCNKAIKTLSAVVRQPSGAIIDPMKNTSPPGIGHGT